MINNVFLGLLLFVCMLDPSNQLFGVKEFLFAITIILFLIKVRFVEYDKIAFNFVFYIFLVMLPLGIFVSCYGKFDLEFILLYLKAFLFSLLVLIAREDSSKFVNIFCVAVFCFGFIYLITVVFYYIYPDFANIFINSNNGLIGRRQYGLINIPMIFLKASPLLILFVPLFYNKYEVENKKVYLIISFLLTIPLLFSGTRANIFSCVFIIFVIVYMNFNKVIRRFVLFFLTILLLPNITSFITKTFLSANEFSLNVKTGHLFSYIELFIKKPLILLWGEGIGQPFYSSGYNEVVYITELTYLDLIRMWGLPISIIFIGFIVRSVFVKQIPIYVKAGIICYLFIAGTNPLLISSTGFMAIALIFSLEKYYSSYSLKANI